MSEVAVDINNEEDFQNEFNEEEKPVIEPEEVAEEQPVEEEVKPVEEEPPVVPEKTAAELALEKQLNDTKSWGHSLAEEKKRMEAELAELRQKVQAATASDIPDDIKSVYEDFPEIKKAIDFEMQRLKNIAPSNDIQTLRAEQAQANFNISVVSGLPDPTTGEWIDGHPDAFKIISSKDFAEFATANNIDPAKVSSPLEAIRIIERFKGGKATEAAAKLAADKKASAEKMAASAGSQLKTGSAPKAKVEPDKNDFQAAFDEDD